MSSPQHRMLGGRLAVDFANLGWVFAGGNGRVLTWPGLITFLEASNVVSPERSTKLLTLPQSDPDAAGALLATARGLQAALRSVFSALVSRNSLEPDSVDRINAVLRVTEGHDELVWEDGRWRVEFVAAEDLLEWLLAAIARSGAEILADPSNARLRSCANRDCGIFFCDTSRTGQRRWCSMATCGNRHKVAAFARRRAQQQS